MRAPSALPRFRARAESRMLDTCRITAPPSGQHTGIDPVTLKYVDPDPVEVYTGKCRLGQTAPAVTQAAAGEAAWDTQDLALHLPVTGTDAVTPGCTVTYLGAADNPALVGRVYGVVAISNASQGTARRCRVREVVS